MDAETVMEIRPVLTTYLHEFEGCFANVRSQRHLETYVAGQLSDLQRKSIEPIADAAGVPPRTLQEFLLPGAENVWQSTSPIVRGSWLRPPQRVSHITCSQ